TVSGNTLLSGASGPGGGIGNHIGTMTLTNSTVSGNTTGSSGDAGGIDNSNGATLSLNNSTITGNVAGATGGGIRNAIGSTVTFKNTIVAGNSAGTTGPDCEGALTSQGRNLVGIGTGCPSGGTGDLTTADAKLGTLGDNGGPTFTHALQSGSPAINAGNPAAPGSGGNACESTDQRGVARPQGAACDIGAFELAIVVLDADLAVSKSVDDSSPQEGETVTFTVTVTNNGPGAATGVVVNDAIPAGLTFQSATTSDGAYATGTGNWTLDSSLASLASATLTLDVSVDAGTAGSTITNTASVTASDQDDSVSGNDSDSAAVTVAIPTPIPSVGTWGLAITATAFVVILAWRSRRRAVSVQP
ncbi:MAG: DUF11 domain-containing protein, partial [Chloroflexi bacterium]|nr:DUF11 domain-containing protein [Chloroflexota bacterium]